MCFTTMAPTKAFVTSQMELAQEHLDDCIASLERGRLRTAVDRAYHAIRQSAVALLCHMEVRPPRSHSGLLTLFGLEVVNKGVMEPRFAQMLRRASRNRMAATYSGDADITEDMARANVENARNFVDKVQERLSSDWNESA